MFLFLFCFSVPQRLIPHHLIPFRQEFTTQFVADADAEGLLVVMFVNCNSGNLCLVTVTRLMLAFMLTVTAFWVFRHSSIVQNFHGF